MLTVTQQMRVITLCHLVVGRRKESGDAYHNACRKYHAGHNPTFPKFTIVKKHFDKTFLYCRETHALVCNSTFLLRPILICYVYFCSCCDGFCKRCRRSKQYNARTVHLNKPLPRDAKYPPNIIRNQKYSVITFIPLVSQRQRVRYCMSTYSVVMEYSISGRDAVMFCKLMYWIVIICT